MLYVILLWTCMVVIAGAIIGFELGASSTLKRTKALHFDTLADEYNRGYEQGYDDGEAF